MKTEQEIKDRIERLKVQITEGKKTKARINSELLKGVLELQVAAQQIEQNILEWVLQ